MIATFLALLELMRQGVVTAKQEGPFAPIVIEAKVADDEAQAR